MVSTRRVAGACAAPARAHWYVDGNSSLYLVFKFQAYSSGTALELVLLSAVGSLLHEHSLTRVRSECRVGAVLQRAEARVNMSLLFSNSKVCCLLSYACFLHILTCVYIPRTAWLVPHGTTDTAAMFVRTACERGCTSQLVQIIDPYFMIYCCCVCSRPFKAAVCIPDLVYGL